MDTHRSHLLITAVKNDLKEFTLDFAKIFHVRNTFYFVYNATLTGFFIAVNHKKQYCKIKLLKPRLILKA